MRLPVASYALPGRNPSRLVNCFAQQSTGKTPVEILGAPGVSTLCTPTYGSEPTTGRALFQVKGQMYAVVGRSLYSVTTAGSYTRIGEIPGETRVMLASDGNTIVTDTGYAYDGATLSYMSDPDRPDFAAVDFCDGFIVYVESGTGRFGCSGLYDATAYDSLDFATAEGSPDNLVTLIVDHRQVVLFGTDTAEVWWNAGAEGFPFERLSGGFIELGCLARFGVCKADNSVFWLASDRSIRRLSGQTPIRVSQHGVEEAISRYSTVSDCEAFSYTWDGHIFVVFRFPTEDRCWVLDVTTGEWHERQTEGKAGWDVSSAVSMGGKVYLLNAVTGSVGVVNDTVYTEFGGTLRREVTFPSVYAEGARLFHSQLDLMFRTGDADLGVTPYVTLDISDDGGTTFRPMVDKPLGEIGEYRKVLRWTRLGYSRDRVYRVACASAVPFHLVDSGLGVTGGAK